MFPQQCNPCIQPDDNGCLYTTQGECIIYTGARNSFTNINPGDNLNVVVNKLITAINSSGGGSLTSANNGTSLNGTIVTLGQDYGDSDNPANLLNNREIPFNSQALFLTGIGSDTNSFLTFVSAEDSDITVPWIQFQNFDQNELLSIRVPDVTSLYIGYFAGATYSTVNGLNIGIGNSVMQFYTSGVQNVAIGYNAMSQGDGGSYNTAIGSNSLVNNEGDQNTAIGQFVLTNNVGGVRNTGMGQAALINRVSANDNVAIGNASLGELLVTTNNSKQNTAVGTGSGQQGNVGDDNVLFGYYTLFSGNAGDNNVLIGSQLFLSGGVSDNNIFIGGKTGKDSSVSVVGNNNIWIGTNNIVSLNNLVNSVVIGQGITAGVNNSVIIGRTDQNIILGSTTSPTDNGAKLQVIGDITTSAPTSGSQGKWKFGKFDATSPTPTGRIKLNVDGVDYWIAVETA